MEPTPDLEGDEGASTPSESTALSSLERRRQVAWELELLISGALLVSLFQAPGWLSRTSERLVMHSSQDTGLLPFLVIYILQMIVMALLGAFLIHFVVRSFWVGLIGLQGAYPGGVRWRKADFSPVQTDVYRRHAPTLAQLEERSDRLASSMFALLFLATFMILVSFLSAMPSYFVARLLNRYVWPEADIFQIFLILYFALITPMMVAQLIDRWFKKRPEALERWPRLRRGLEKVMTFYHYLFLGPLSAPLLAVFSTHTSSRWTTVGSIVVSLALGVTMIVTQLASAGALGFDSYVYFPRDPKQAGLDAAHYESLDALGERVVVPTIQSDMITDPYVRLFLPFDPRRDTEQLEELCPELEPIHSEGLSVRLPLSPDATEEQRRASLACFRRLYTVSLDDQELENLELSFYTHPVGDTRGVLAYLPTRDLAPGKHQLKIVKQLDEEETPEKQERARRLQRGVYYLPFWI